MTSGENLFQDDAMVIPETQVTSRFCQDKTTCIPETQMPPPFRQNCAEIRRDEVHVTNIFFTCNFDNIEKHA